MDKRFEIKIVGMVVAFVLIMALIHWFDTPRVEMWTYHAVAEGDTLWSIAKKYNPDYNGDIRHITRELKKANGMTNSMVYVGDLLEVPVMGG